MYKIERKSFGFQLTFSGKLQEDEWQRWYDDSVEKLQDAPRSFGVIIDMRGLTPLASDRQKTIVKGQQLYRNKGMIRSAVILNNAVTTYQFKKLAQHSGIYSFERYIDAELHENRQQIATDWVTKGIDPDA